MAPVEWLVALVWLAGALSFGVPAALRLLKAERRIAVVFPFAYISGHCFQSVVLALLWGLVPIGAAFYLSVAISMLAGVVLWFVRQTSSGGGGRLTVSRGDALATGLLLLVSAALAHQIFTFAYSTENQEALFYHSAVVGMLSRDVFPPVSPLEPDDPLRYRYGIHLFGAALASTSGALPTTALATAVTMLMPMVVLALVGASLRMFASVRPGILAALLGLFGGPISVYYYAIQEMFGIRQSVDVRDAIGGIVWHGNALDMLAISFTVGMGFVVFACALWLVWETGRQPKVGAVSVMVTVAGLAYLGLVNETYFAALAAAAVGVPALQTALAPPMSRSTSLIQLLRAVGVTVGAFALVGLKGGLAGGIALFGDGPNSMQLTLNLDHAGSVITAPRGAADQWIPLLSLEGLTDTNFWMLGLPLLLVLAFRSHNVYSTYALSASAVVFVPWVLFYPRGFPADIYRFGQASMMIYIAMLPMVLAPLWAAAGERSKALRFYAVSLALVALTVPHLVRDTALVLSRQEPVLLPKHSVDYEAARFLSASRTTGRVLVPFEAGDGSWEIMYDKRPNTVGTAMRTILAYGGHAIPVGHQVYWNPQAYLPFYREASLYLSSASLSTLKVDWVYILPAVLRPEQKASQQEAERAGRIELKARFGEQDTPSERLLYRVCPDS